MTKTLRGFRFVIIVLGLLIFATVVSARTERPFQDDDAAQLYLDKPHAELHTVPDRLNPSHAVTTVVETSAPSFTSQPLNLTYTTSPHWKFSMIDMDSDGDIDLLGDKLFWWENDGDFGFSEHIIPTETNSSFVKGFDIDDDGDTDIVTYVDPRDNPDGYIGKLLWWENDGDQNFTPSLISEATIISTNYSPVIVDLDQDGDGDLIYATIGHLYWCEFTDSGWVSHTILNSISSSFKGLEDIVTGDFDGDGDLDIVVPNDYYNQSIIFPTFNRRAGGLFL